MNPAPLAGILWAAAAGFFAQEPPKPLDPAQGKPPPAAPPAAQQPPAAPQKPPWQDF